MFFMCYFGEVVVVEEENGSTNSGNAQSNILILKSNFKFLL